MFGSPKVSAPAPPPPPPAPPTVDDTAIAARQEEDRFRKRQGTQANIKSTGAGPVTAAAALLGS